MAENHTVPEALKNFFKENRRVAVAFSGGVDSAYLLYAAKQCQCKVRAYYVHSQFQPRFELEDAKRLSEELGISMRILKTDVLSIPEIVKNPPDRCYFCKQALFTKIIHAAQQDGFPVLCDGTNATDDAGDRPGIRALQELSVRSPLRECGIGKPQVRAFSQQAGLFTWNKPAYACLATRIASGAEITADLLEKVEHAEQSLAKMGFSDFRVRVFHDAARIQLPEAQFPLALEKHREIEKLLSSDFSGVLLDLNAR